MSYFSICTSNFVACLCRDHIRQWVHSAFKIRSYSTTHIRPTPYLPSSNVCRLIILASHRLFEIFVTFWKITSIGLYFPLSLSNIPLFLKKKFAHSLTFLKFGYCKLVWLVRKCKPVCNVALEIFDVSFIKRDAYRLVAPYSFSFYNAFTSRSIFISV